MSAPTDEQLERWLAGPTPVDGGFGPDGVRVVDALVAEVRALRAERAALRALLVRVRNRLAVTAEAIDEVTA